MRGCNASIHTLPDTGVIGRPKSFIGPHPNIYHFSNALLLYQTNAYIQLQNIRSRKLVKQQEETRRDFIRRTWASYTTGQITDQSQYVCKMCYKFFTSTLVVGSYHAWSYIQYLYWLMFLTASLMNKRLFTTVDLCFSRILFCAFALFGFVLMYTVSKKPDTCDIFKYLQQIWTNINNFWYRESPINLQSLDTKLPCEIL